MDAHRVQLESTPPRGDLKVALTVTLVRYRVPQPVAARTAQLGTRPRHPSNHVSNARQVNTLQRRAHQAALIVTTDFSKLLLHKPDAAHALSARKHQTTQTMLTRHVKAASTGTSKQWKDKASVQNVLWESKHRTTETHTHNATIVTPGLSSL